MSNLTPELEGHSIVLLGSFNPQIFQPAWFGNQELVRKEEAENASIEIIHPRIVIFSMEWFQLQVTPDRFCLSTVQVHYYEPLRDLTRSIFQILRHTPIDKMGLNRDLHYLMPSEESWHRVGDRLAPKEPWKEILQKPGMRTLIMEGARPDGLEGIIGVRVEPSARVKPGVFIAVNDHYEVGDFEPSQGAHPILKILEKYWEASLPRSLQIAESLMADR